MPAEYGAPQVGVALMHRASVFASGENLGAGRIHFHRAMKYLAVTNKYPPAKPGVFLMRAKPYVTSPRVSSRKYGLPAARVSLPATRKRV